MLPRGDWRVGGGWGPRRSGRCHRSLPYCPTRNPARDGDGLPPPPRDDRAVPDGPELGRLRRAILGEIREKVRILLPVDLGELYEWTMATASEDYIEGDGPPVNDDQD